MSIENLPVRLVLCPRDSSSPSRAGSRSSRPCEFLELAKCVAVMAKKGPVVTEEQHAHQVEPDRAIAGVEMLGEVGCRQSLEGATIENFLGETLAAVLIELAADEDQVVFFVGDEVDGIAAVRPPLFEDFETPALEIAPDALHCLGADGFHD